MLPPDEKKLHELKEHYDAVKEEQTNFEKESDSIEEKYREIENDVLHTNDEIFEA